MTKTLCKVYKGQILFTLQKYEKGNMMKIIYPDYAGIIKSKIYNLFVQTTELKYWL